jgi:hypothetical protein
MAQGPALTGSSSWGGPGPSDGGMQMLHTPPGLPWLHEPLGGTMVQRCLWVGVSDGMAVMEQAIKGPNRSQKHGIDLGVGMKPTPFGVWPSPTPPR